MKKYQILSELRMRSYHDKVFLYNPWSDNILELSELSWKIVLEINQGKNPKTLAMELEKKLQKDYKTILAKIKKTQEELIRWGILITY